MAKQPKEKKQFSKSLLVQESVLIWIITITFLVLAFVCVFKGFFGELPWLTVIVAFPWTAYGVSQGFYYRKSMKENTKDGVTYLKALKDLGQTDDAIEEDKPIDG